MKKGLLLMGILALFVMGGCDSDESKNEETKTSCEDVTCSGHGSCRMVVDAPICVCEVGYHVDGLECIENNTENPCEGITCSGHGTCSDNNGAPSCLCESGYMASGTSCIKAEEVVSCGTLTGPATGCSVTAGSGDKILLKGIILGEQSVFQGGSVLISGDGVIECVGCDCAASATNATQVICPAGVISPALINAHDHVGWTTQPPASYQSLYDHRHEWRKGKNGKPKVSSGSSSYKADPLSWGELRNIIAGTTSLAGSGGTAGFLRNVDKGGSLNEGANLSSVYYETFPLGTVDRDDANLYDSGCSKYDIDAESVMKGNGCYLPHVAEGINAAAHNEFLCVSSSANSGNDLLEANSAFIHGVGVDATDGEEMASNHSAVIWSPRSNISLYGNTAPVTMFAHQGVLIGLGTDWTPSGSINMFREIQCADYLNKNHFNNFFTDKQIWEMATRNNAEALLIADRLGVIKVGHIADISIFDLGDAANAYRAVLNANVNNVLLVLRGGEPMYGDKDIMAKVPGGQDGCSDMGDVCGVQKTVCVEREMGKTYAALKAANSGSYGLFFCGVPTGEPTCMPNRPSEYDGVTATDKDGDGVADGSDNCPNIFNPIRPMDNGKQSDIDNDGKGDVCDNCPTIDGDSCNPYSAYDKDDDGVESLMDNCPIHKNADQADRDHDGKGDVCDSCPDVSNPGAMGCPSTIEAIKQGIVKTGATVTIKGVVTALDSKYADNFYIQTAVEDQDSTLKEKFSGLYVYKSGDKTLKLGDYISISGSVEVYFDQLELISITDITKLTETVTMPAPVVVEPSKVATGGSDADAYEGVLVVVKDVTVTNIAPTPMGGDKTPTNEIEVTGGLRINDNFYQIPTPAVDDTFTSITGIMRWNRENHKLEPRNAADVVK